LYLLKKYTTFSLKEIGDLFKMDYAAVSQACKRFEEKTRIDKSVLNLKTAVENALKRKSEKKGREVFAS
jgi:putative transposase